MGSEEAADELVVALNGANFGQRNISLDVITYIDYIEFNGPIDRPPTPPKKKSSKQQKDGDADGEE